MADIELTTEEFNAKLAEAKADGLKNLIEGTTWKDVDGMKESALNADKKISELGGENKTLTEKLTEAQKQKEASDIKTTKTNEPEAKTPEEVIESLSEKEAEILDAAIVKNPDLKKKIAEGGEKAQAEAILAVRDQIPKEIPDNLFSTIAKGKGKKITKLDENSIASLLSSSFEKSRKKGLTPATLGVGGRVATSPDTDEAPVIRGGGGLSELAAEERP